MSDYLIIDKIKLTKIEGAKTLQLAHYDGLTFAVDMTYTEDELYAIFLPDGQLSKEYADANDLVSRIDPVTGKNAGGFFGKNRKVRTIKLMGGKIISCGFINRLSSLAFTGYDISTLKKGDTFDELNGVPIVSKFITEATRKASKNNNSPTKNKKKNETIINLHEHVKTNMFMKNIDNIPEGSTLIITEKLDGTSVRIGNVLESDATPTLISKILARFGYIKKDKYIHITGTRRVIIRNNDNGGYYRNNSIYTEVGDMLENKLRPGEIIYGEILGWRTESQALFNRGGTIMKYGCEPGTRKFRVYAITREMQGQTIQVPWIEVKRRCDELGLEYVPEFFTISSYSETEKDKILNFITSWATGLSTLDSSHIKEGVVIRVENGFDSYFLKYKTPEFYALEDKSKNDENFVDMEDLQNI